MFKKQNKQKSPKTKITYLLGIFVLFSIINFTLSTNNSIAALDPEITYHGKLTDATLDTAVPNGTYNFTISIYDTDIGGNCLWTARGTCSTPTSKSITITNGIFNTTLGEAGDNTLSSLSHNTLR